jgi:hypothetical protein
VQRAVAEGAGPLHCVNLPVRARGRGPAAPRVPGAMAQRQQRQQPRQADAHGGWTGLNGGPNPGARPGARGRALTEAGRVGAGAIGDLAMLEAREGAPGRCKSGGGGVTRLRPVTAASAG